MSVTNPRFPHWCRIVRKTVDDPLEDEEDFSPLDGEDVDGYDPLGSDNAQTGTNGQQEVSQTEEADTDEDTVEGTQVTVIYEGECRSYKVNTTSDKGEVITSYRGLALPLNQDGWDELGVSPREGDEIIVVHGKTAREYGRVIDKSIATASFAGTHLVWKYGRN